MDPSRARPIGVVIPVILLVLALPLCVTVLRQQMVIHRLQGAISGFDTGRTGPARIVREIDEADQCGKSCPPETRLLVAVADADAGMKAQGGTERQRLLARAMESAEEAVIARPGWGEALATSAAIADLQGGNDANSMRYFQRSYAAAPYLRTQSLWRLGYGSTHWARLDETTRHAVIREANWLARIGPKDRAQAAAALGDTPAGARFALTSQAPPDAAATPAQDQ